MSILEYYTRLQVRQMLRLSSVRLSAYVKAGILHPVYSKNGGEYFLRDEVRHVARFTVPSQAAAQFLFVSREGLVDLGNQGYLTPFITPSGRSCYDQHELNIVRAHLVNYMLTHTAVCERLSVTRKWLLQEIKAGHVSYVRVGGQTRVNLQEVREHVESCSGVRVSGAARILQTSPGRVRYLANTGHLTHHTTVSQERIFRPSDFEWYLTRTAKK